MARNNSEAAFSEEDIIASICRDSFYAFVQEFWDVVIPETPVWNWHIKFICDELQTVAERVFRGEAKEYDLIINVPPGSSKSTICSVMFPAWLWIRMARSRCLCGSFAHQLALDLSRKCRDIIQSDKYRKCFPDIKLRDDQNTKAYYANTKGGIRYSVGTGGAVMGMHGHFLIVDDPLDPQEAMSDADLKSANHWMTETLSQRKVDKAVSVTIIIMQRLHQDDPTGARIANTTAGPVRVICLPAEETEDISPPEVKIHYDRAGGLLDPIRLPPRVLQEALGLLGEFGYAGQMLQAPVPRGGAMFQVDKIHIMRDAPAQFRKITRYWDKAGTSKGGAYTVGVKMGVDMSNRFWVLDVVRGQWDSHVREAMIQATATLDGPIVWIGVEQEPGAAGLESAENTIRNLAGFRVMKDKPTGDKETRADTFSTQVNAGNVYLLEGDWNEEYIKELRYFPKSKYKDQVDASSGAFASVAKPRIYVGAL